MDGEKQKLIDYEGFEIAWKKRHKASLPKRKSVSSLSTIFWIGFWVIVSIGAAIFSGAHTIPAALKTLFEDIANREYLAQTAFVIVEFVIFGAAAKRHEIKWLNILLLCSISVALIANTSSSVAAVAQNDGSWLDQISGILLSIIAPVTALAAGEVLHLQLSGLAERKAKADEDFRQQWKELDAKINAAYTKLEREQKAELEAINSLNLIKNNNLTRQKPSVKLQKALDYLTDNPDKLDIPARELEEEIGMSYGTIFRAQQQIKQSSNGHSANGADETEG